MFRPLPQAPLPTLLLSRQRPDRSRRFLPVAADQDATPPQSSVSPPLPHKIHTGINQALPVLEEPVAVPPDKLDLMPATFLHHRLDSLDGMHAGQFRYEFSEQMRFCPRAIQRLIAGEENLFQHDLLGADEQLKSVLIGQRDALGQFGRFVGHSIHAGEFRHRPSPLAGSVDLHSPGPG